MPAFMYDLRLHQGRENRLQGRSFSPKPEPYRNPEPL